MGKYEKLLIKILRGTSDKNIDFEEFRNLLLRLGFGDVCLMHKIDEIRLPTKAFY